MAQAIGLVTLLVRDYDEAIRFFVDRLDFDLVRDDPLEAGKRWVVVGPAGGVGARLLLARAADDAERDAVGRQAAGRVSLFLTTDDFARDHAAYLMRGVRFHEAPRIEVYGTVAVFEDLYGNYWDLIEPTQL